MSEIVHNSNGNDNGGHSNTKNKPLTLIEFFQRLPWYDVICWMSFLSNTSLLAFLARSMRKPQLETFFFGFPASELCHFILSWQTIYLSLLSYINPSMFRDSWLGKIGLLFNLRLFYTFMITFAENLQSRQYFQAALESGGILSKKYDVQSNWKYLLFSLLPLPSMARIHQPNYMIKAGKSNVYHIPYANINELDPKLVERYKSEPKNARLLNMYVGRGNMMKWLSLDIIRHDRTLSNAPVLFYVHGGGWTVGDKLFAGKALIERCASHGMVVVVINYRLAPTRQWPILIHDVKRALIWTKKNISQYGGDPNKITISGESAGGHLSSLVACTVNEPRFQPPEFPDEDTSVLGCIDLYGVHDFLDEAGHYVKLHPARIPGMSSAMAELLERIVFQRSSKGSAKDEFEFASPLYHVKKKTLLETPPQNPIPPFMVIHGTKDSLASYDDSQTFFDAIVQYRNKWGSWREGENDIFVTLPGAHHAFGYIVSPRALACADAMAEFAFHHSARISNNQ